MPNDADTVPSAARDEADGRFMARALELAALGAGAVSPNPMVGAVLVKRGRIIGEGWHRGPGHPHAEIEAFAACAMNPAGSTLYVTLEPCNHEGRTPPCAPAVIERKIARVVAPHADPNPLVAGQGFRRLRAAGIEVDTGVLEAEARRLNEAFLTFHKLRRPFITAKWAMTLDGRIATESGDSKWISNEESRHYVHQVRSRVDAVMAGIGTVLLDNPVLNVRLPDYDGRQPKKILVDGSLRIPARAKCLVGSPPGHCIIVTSEGAAPDRMARLRDAGHVVLPLKARRGVIDMADMVAALPRHDIQSVLCEGGSGMHGAMLRARLVDKVIAFIAPKIIGAEEGGRGPVVGWSVDLMRKALQLRDVTTRVFGADVCVEGYVPDSCRNIKPMPPQAISITGSRRRNP